MGTKELVVVFLAQTLKENVEAVETSIKQCRKHRYTPKLLGI
jgi:hypothetical protein